MRATAKRLHDVFVLERVLRLALEDDLAAVDPVEPVEEFRQNRKRVQPSAHVLDQDRARVLPSCYLKDASIAASTTLKLPERLKQRIAPLARSAGKTPHAWMVEALEVHAALAERRKAFVAEALAAEKEAGHTGRAYRAEDVHRYLRARVAGRKAKRPKPVRW